MRQPRVAKQMGREIAWNVSVSVTGSNRCRPVLDVVEGLPGRCGERVTSQAV